MFCGRERPIRGCFVTFLVGDADQLYEFHRAAALKLRKLLMTRLRIRDYAA